MEMQSMSLQKQSDLQSSSGMTTLRNEGQCCHVGADGWKCCHEIARHRVMASFEEGCKRTGLMRPPSDTTTAITAQANTQARAGALMAHHPAWVGHHTGGSRSKPTVHPCPLRWGGCGLLTNSSQVSQINEPKSDIAAHSQKKNEVHRSKATFPSFSRLNVYGFHGAL